MKVEPFVGNSALFLLSLDIICVIDTPLLVACPSVEFSSTIIVSSKYLKDEDINELWKILGRIADDPNNRLHPSEDAEIFIGYYE